MMLELPRSSTIHAKARPPKFGLHEDCPARPRPSNQQLCPRWRPRSTRRPQPCAASGARRPGPPGRAPRRAARCGVRGRRIRQPSCCFGGGTTRSMCLGGCRTNRAPRIPLSLSSERRGSGIARSPSQLRQIRPRPSYLKLLQAGDDKALSEPGVRCEQSFNDMLSSDWTSKPALDRFDTVENQRTNYLKRSSHHFSLTNFKLGKSQDDAEQKCVTDLLARGVSVWRFHLCWK